jgi:hypothetical protein
MSKSYNENQNRKGSSNRTFGIVMALFFTGVAAFPLINGEGDLRFWALNVGGCFLILSLVYPNALSKLNYLWTCLGSTLNKVSSPIILGFIFYMIILPLGLAQRFLGKDILKLKRNSSAKSYWIIREPPGPDPKHMNKQF